MNAVLIFSFGIGGVAVVASYLQGRKTPWGWALGFATEVSWIIVGIVTVQWSAAIAGLTYASMAVWNFIKWRREELCC